MAAQTSPAARSPRGSSTKGATAKIAKNGSAKKDEKRASTIVAPMIDPEHRRALIAQAAYFRAERRNFAPGYETEDWLSAESEVDTALTLGVLPSDN